VIKMAYFESTWSDEHYYYVGNPFLRTISRKVPIWRCKKCNGANTFDKVICSNCGTPKPKIKTNKDPEKWTEPSYDK
jgi:hypothetical protein